MGCEIENTDSRGRRSVNSYDGYGRLIKTVNTDGDIVTETSKEYNNNGSVTIETAEDGTVTEYTYDDMDRVVTRTVQKGNFSKTWNTSYSYEDVTIFTGKGTQTKTVENAFKTTETTPDGISEVTWQDHLGRVIREFKNGAYMAHI